MRVVAGIDIGSLATKTVLMNERGDVLSYNIMRSGYDYEGAAEQSLNNCLKSASIERQNLKYILSTGYGRAVAKLSNLADAEVTEITCHAKGARMVSSDIRTVIDIGGQDSKVIAINDDGNVSNFVMNDRCAAGTGRFLEVMAGALSIGIEEMGNLMLSSTKKVEVSSICTVFAETEVISLFAQGNKKHDIAAGIADSIARRITGLVGQVGLREKMVMSGGVAKNVGVVRFIEKNIGAKLLIPPEPQIIGALGAAIIATQRI